MNHKRTEGCQPYTHQGLNRRDFFRRSSILGGSAVVAYVLIRSLENDRSRAEIISQDDPRLQTERMKYPGATGDVRAYFAKPQGDEKLPGVVVIHENRGLNAHTEDVTRRVALEGFLAMAPDALSPVGGTPENPDQARSLIQNLDPESTTENYVAAVRYLKTHPQSSGKVGCIGFCWGGAMVNQVAVHSSDVLAVVPFYGRPPASEDVPEIKASLLLHYAGLDEVINKGIPEFEAALKKASIDYKLYMYEGAQHAFFNDTNPERYDRQAAQLAWRRTVSFLEQKLKR